MNIISVGIVEDNREIRQALELIVTMDKHFTLACSCRNAEDALIEIAETKPRVVLMDINLGSGMNGIECVRQLKESNPDILFMMCTILEEDEKIFEALSAGASGYILKKTTPAKLLEAIQELDAGGSPMSSQIARKVVAAFQQKPLPAQPAPSSEMKAVLSKREIEILEMLSKGLLYKEIADQLFISPETVKKHVYHIYEKLHVSNRVEAINRYYGR